MSIWTIALALSLGFTAGVLAGIFGVGGGILFVPTLVALGLGQVEASATSLLAIVPTAAVATARQQSLGNLRARSALIVGLSSIAGAEAGVRIATHVSETHLRRAFGLLMLGVAVQLVVRSARGGRRYPGSS